MSKRAEHRARYIEGWDSMDAGKLLASIADGFIFDDPADPRPVNKATLVAYMAVWPRRAALLGGGGSNSTWPTGWCRTETACCPNG